MPEHKIKGKKGQGAEAMTWVAATVIVFIATFLFLLATSGLAKEKNARVSIGTLEVFGAHDSGIATQQMLYAILNSKYGEEKIEMQSLIAEGRYNEVRGAAFRILERFKNEGILCNFFVKESKRGGYLIEIDQDAKGIPLSLILGKDEVSLQCQE